MKGCTIVNIIILQNQDAVWKHRIWPIIKKCAICFHVTTPIECYISVL